MSENLIPFNQLTEDEQRILASKGGIASGVARRQKKAMKEQMEMLLSLKHTNPKNLSKMQELGIEEEDMNNQMAMIVAIWNQALKGNTKAMNTIASITGEAVQVIKVDTVTDEKVKELQDLLNGE